MITLLSIGSDWPLLIIPAIIVAIFLLIFIPMIVVTEKGKGEFLRKCEQIKKGMTLQEVMSILGKDELIETQKPMYKWEHSYWAGRAGSRTFYLTAVFENDILTMIDTNFN